MKKLCSLLVTALLLMLMSIPAYADGGRVTVTQNDGGKIELHSDAKEIASGIYTIAGNAQILFHITADKGYTLAHVYFNEQDVGFVGEGTKEVWLSPNGASTALRVEFQLISKEASSSTSQSSTASNSGSITSNSGSITSNSGSITSNSGSITSEASSESQSSSDSQVQSIPLNESSMVSSIAGGALDNKNMMNDGVGVIDPSNGINVNWKAFGVIAAVVAAVVGALTIVIFILRKVGKE